MADLQMDTLGAPKEVTGSDYMDALARLGWNKTNMDSSLPTMTAVAGSLTSFMDQQYNQNLDYQKAKTAMAASVANANNVDAQTQQIQALLPYHVKQMDLANQQAQTNLSLANQTQQYEIQKAKIAAEQADQNYQHSKVIDPLLEQQQQQTNTQTATTLQELQSQSQRNTDAQADLPAALNDVPQANDTDFDQKLTDFYTKHANVATNPQTQKQIQDKITAVTQQRGQLASFQQQQSDRTTLIGMKARGDLGQSTDIDATVKDPVAAHSAIVQGNIIGKQRQVSELMNTIPYNAPPDVVQAMAGLRNEQAVMNQILGTDDGVKAVASGRYSQFFDTNGNLNPSLQGNLDVLTAYNAERVKQGLAKPVEGKMTIIDPNAKTGDKNPQKIEIENVPIDKMSSTAATAAEAFPKTPAEKAELDQNAQAVANKDVSAMIESDPQIKAAKDSGDWDSVNKLLQQKLQRTQQQQQQQQTQPPGTSSSSQDSNASIQPVAFQPDTSGSQRINAVFNNPGAMGLTKSALRFGATPSGKMDTGHAFAQFPTREAGAAAQFSMWQNPALYRDHSLADAITNWVGPGEQGEAEYIANRIGIPLGTTIDDAFLRSPMGIKLMQAQAQYEGQNVLTPEQWQRGQDWAYKGVNPFAGHTASAMPVHANGHPMPRTPEEAVTLPSGTRFMDPNGVMRYA